MVMDWLIIIDIERGYNAFKNAGLLEVYEEYGGSILIEKFNTDWDMN